MAQMKIMCGLPRSGKTTFAKGLEPQGWVRVSPDDIRLALHGQPFVATAESWVWAIAETMARSLLIGGRDVVIDATNVTRQERKGWVRLARACDAHVSIEWMRIEPIACVLRSRPDEHVPNDVIWSMAQRFEDPTCGDDDVREIHEH